MPIIPKYLKQSMPDLRDHTGNTVPQKVQGHPLYDYPGSRTVFPVWSRRSGIPCLRYFGIIGMQCFFSSKFTHELSFNLLYQVVPFTRVPLGAFTIGVFLNRPWQATKHSRGRAPVLVCYISLCSENQAAPKP